MARGVYPDDPDACFEEGVFLSPKMYSIKNRHTHIKGVKLDSVRHEALLSCLKSKSPNLKVDSTFQFVKQDYNIYLRGVNKVFTL